MCVSSFFKLTKSEKEFCGSWEQTGASARLWSWNGLMSMQTKLNSIKKETKISLPAVWHLACLQYSLLETLLLKCWAATRLFRIIRSIYGKFYACTNWTIWSKLASLSPLLAFTFYNLNNVYVWKVLPTMSSVEKARVNCIWRKCNCSRAPPGWPLSQLSLLRQPGEWH